MDQTPSELPLCVDLDGTLVRADTLYEAFVTVMLGDLRLLARIPAWLSRGKAGFKQEVAARWRFDPTTLPYNEAFLDFLKEERARGRQLVLATAADRTVARHVADHLGLFDEVIASDGTHNMRGEAKARALVDRFGAKNFAYAGNDGTDHAVWDVAGEAILVSAPPSVTRAARERHNVAREIGDRPALLPAAVRTLRPYQWVKNLLAVIPLLGAGAMGDAQAWLGAVAMFGAFSAMASGLYVINDISDLAADRQHPSKALRPFASGALSVAQGLALVPPLWALALALGQYSGALPVLLLYAAASVAYSCWLKEEPLVDVFALAGLYTLRLFGGGVASGYPVSLWLLGFSSFFFLSLALIKRVSELSRLQASNQVQAARRGYSVHDLEVLQTMGIGSTFVSSLVLSLYAQSDIASRYYASPSLLWAVIPLLLFWQCRLWLSTARGDMHDDPIIFALRDWVSWAVLASLVVAVLAARLQFG